MLVLIITSGYAIVRTSIPGWWIWAYWISPFAYGLRAVVINELTAPDWSRIQSGTSETVGAYALKQFGFFTERCVPHHLQGNNSHDGPVLNLTRDPAYTTAFAVTAKHESSSAADHSMHSMLNRISCFL